MTSWKPLQIRLHVNFLRLGLVDSELRGQHAWRHGTARQALGKTYGFEILSTLEDQFPETEVSQNGWSITENPIYKWMITGGTPILRNFHISTSLR